MNLLRLVGDHLEPLSQGFAENRWQWVDVLEDDIVGKGELFNVRLHDHLARWLENGQLNVKNGTIVLGIVDDEEDRKDGHLLELEDGSVEVLIAAAIDSSAVRDDEQQLVDVAAICRSTRPAAIWATTVKEREGTLQHFGDSCLLLVKLKLKRDKQLFHLLANSMPHELTLENILKALWSVNGSVKECRTRTCSPKLRTERAPDSMMESDFPRRMRDSNAICFERLSAILSESSTAIRIWYWRLLGLLRRSQILSFRKSLAT